MSDKLVPTPINLSIEQLACYAVSVACTGGGVYGYLQRQSLPSLIAGLGFGALYGYSGRLIGTGRPLDGVDLSIVASMALLAAMGPKAYNTGATVPTSLSGIASIVLLRMGYMSYYMRHH